MALTEEQAGEIEALSSIYGDDFLPGGTPTSFSLILKPSTSSSGEPTFVGVTLTASLPARYPDAEPPSLSLSHAVGLSAPQLVELQRVAVGVAMEQAGAPCVYNVAEALREWLTSHNERPSDGSAFDEMQRRQRAADAATAGGGAPSGVLAREADPSVKHRAAAPVEEDEAVRRRRDGTPVTRETFLAWREGFEAEAARRKEEAERCVAAPGAGARARERLFFTHNTQAQHVQGSGAGRQRRWRRRRRRRHWRA
jgi:hypothetical protein